MKLLLIRRGQSVANVEGRLQGWLDSPLCDLGQSQVQALPHPGGQARMLGLGCLAHVQAKALHIHNLDRLTLGDGAFNGGSLPQLTMDEHHAVQL